MLWAYCIERIFEFLSSSVQHAESVLMDVCVSHALASHDVACRGVACRGVACRGFFEVDADKVKLSLMDRCFLDLFRLFACVEHL